MCLLINEWMMTHARCLCGCVDDVMCIWRLTESDKIARLITFQVAGIRIYLT
jgi:hypothetical protein